MSGTGGTSVSNMRPPAGAPRRGETRRAERRRIGLSWGVHIVIMALAVLLWWIARDMVSVTQQLQDAGRVRFEISEKLRGDWRILSQSTLPISLEVAGPTKEINDFAAELDQSPGRFVYRYVINEADIENLTPNSRQQLTLTADIRKFEVAGDAVVPLELSVRPIGSERVFQVTLERYVTKPAFIDLGDSDKGQVQIRPSDTSQPPRPYSYTATPKPTHALEVRGPASLVEAITDPDERARLQVSIDAMQALENFARSNQQSVEQVLQQGSLVSNMQLLPIEGVEVMERYTDEQGAEQTRAVSLVNVRIDYTPMQDYVQVTRDFPVEIVLPNWLAQKSARVENLPSSVKVDMKVLSSQQTSFNENNVHVRLDLSSLSRNDLTDIETIEGTQLKRARVLNWYYSLEINTDRITYEFVSDRVTAEQYLPIGEITIVWTE